jgi:hypothetical protein
MKNLISPSRVLGSTARRRALFFFATVAAFLLLTLPAFSQVTDKPPLPAAPTPSAEAKPADQSSGQSSTQSSAQSPAQNNPKDQSSQSSKDAKEPEKNEKKKSDRMFYVMPNYLTVDNQSQVPPINWKEKFSITLKGTFDPYEFVIVGVVAGIRQAENSYPAFGQGAAGYGKRYGAAFADQAIGNIMVGAVFPSILKIDPRYFRMGKGGFRRRFFYAADRIFIARKDSGGHMFNVPEFLGNATAIGISNAYYPAQNRSVSSNLSGWGLQMGIDAFGNELKEFWPDIQKRYLKRKKSEPPQPTATP